MTQISNLQSNVPIHHDKILQQEKENGRTP